MIAIITGDIINSQKSDVEDLNSETKYFTEETAE